ncbi:hypothetical protein KKA95_03870 [Patescibacteria group bacterium]|nr:hypothetical protein [Patescibacteria group bacterium]
MAVFEPEIIDKRPKFPKRETLMYDVEETKGDSILDQLSESKKELMAPLLVLAGIAIMSYFKPEVLEGEDEAKEQVDTKNELSELREDVSTTVGVDIVPAESGEINFGQERFNKLAKEKGNKVAFFSKQIYERYATALEFGKEYQSEVRVENYDGSARNITNNCVGFVMSVLSGLPFKISDSAESNMGRYLSEYHWSGKDGLEHFIPDIAGNDATKYHRTENLDPDNIDEQVGQHLAIGEYAVAAFWNHVLLIYKDIDGEIKMVHSGANVDSETAQAEGYSRVNETTLSAYAKRMETSGQRMKFAFIPISNIVELAENSRNSDMENYYYDNMQYVA